MDEGYLDNRKAFFPELNAGGFSRADGTIDFYTRVNALLRPDMHVLDYGAGRGVHLDRKDAPYRTALNRIQGKVERLVGVDVDRAVLENPFLDEAHILDPARPLPFPDDSFDLIFADWVIEHVPEPAAFAAEVSRLLKKGGWFCARTPNRWGMTGLGTTLIPNSRHARLLKKLQPGREERDVFPTTYKMNTKRAIARYFPSSDWENYTYTHNAEPPYLHYNKALFALGLLYYRLAPAALATNLHIFLRKK